MIQFTLNKLVTNRTLLCRALWYAVHSGVQCTLMSSARWCARRLGYNKGNRAKFRDGRGLIYTKHVSNISALWRASHFNLQKRVHFSECAQDILVLLFRVKLFSYRILLISTHFGLSDHPMLLAIRFARISKKILWFSFSRLILWAIINQSLSRRYAAHCKLLYVAFRMFFLEESTKTFQRNFWPIKKQRMCYNWLNGKVNLLDMLSWERIFDLSWLINHYNINMRYH